MFATTLTKKNCNEPLSSLSRVNTKPWQQFITLICQISLYKEQEHNSKLRWVLKTTYSRLGNNSLGRGRYLISIKALGYPLGRCMCGQTPKEKGYNAGKAK